ncbi:hypothetical protein KRP22_003243 [Phytophthora ramorum]|uniref:Uncharacterized protein n=1 Tax=Phytophthora ramorum TaxID=164328 RepID=H3GI42_PHYRM|nr:hypothetical protein KRP23_10167 [Phytophthora ramorum]KAH7503848.1 hypothetical protein KRP22_6895 [Phytophthora ramorum]
MTSTSLCANTLTDVTTTTSIFEILFKQKESLSNPEEEEDSSLTKDTEIEQQLSLPVKQPTLLGDLHLLQQLTQQLQSASLSTASNNHEDDEGDAARSATNTETENLANLYCRRAAALLAFVDYDASTAVPLDILASGPSATTVSDEANQAAPMLEAIRQALQDSQAAAALTLNNATIAEAHLLSAYCSRSLGELAHACAFTALAAAALPESSAITSLAEQLDVEARADSANLLPKLRMTSAAISMMATSSSVQVAMDQHEDDGDNNDQPEQRATKQPAVASTLTPTEHSSFWNQIATHFQVLEEGARSTWLEKLEHLMHLNIHHRCALPAEVRQLDAALQTALATLALLLQSSIACSALGLDMADDAAVRTVEKLTQAASTSSQTLVQNRTARKWIVHTWAPAVRRAAESASTSSLADLSSDVLLMLARLLQASGSWRRCTAMAHSLAYAEMGFELAKHFNGNNSDSAVWSRLEMQCAEAHATALLQRTTGYEKALKTFRESLQAALHVGDREYELRARVHVAKTLQLMEEPEIAHAELVQVLTRSRALKDVHIEAMAEYEMGEHFVQTEDLEEAQQHFHAAQTLCNRTGNCGSAWRPRSIQQAIAFYARLRPTVRRGAMRCSVSTLLRSVNDEGEEEEQSENEVNDNENRDQEDDEIEESQRPKARRQAFCLKHTSPQPRSLMSAIMNTAGNSLSGGKPKRTMGWRESVFATAWPSSVGDSK